MPPSAHPYMASSAPALKQELLEATGASSVEELFEQIPESHRLRGELNLPPALVSEVELRRHLLDSLRKNVTCEETLSFLGGGCWQHHVPAICDELVARTEFVTSIWGTPSSDHGRNQTWFEFASQLAELIDMDFVGMPVYSFGCAAGHAIRMASRITGRHEVLVPAWMDPERLAVIRTYCEPREMARHIDVVLVDHDPGDGPARPCRPRAQALRRHRGGVRREPLVPRTDRVGLRDRPARPRQRRRADRRRRSDLARRARSSRRPTAPTSSSARHSRSACT